VSFLNLNLEILRQKVNNELFVIGAFEKWYTEQVALISSWLSERLEISLNTYQLSCMSLIVKVILNICLKIIT